MMNKLKTFKDSFNSKKVGILLGALLLGIALGGGTNNAFAGQSIETALLNWFGDKRTVAEQEIADAITEEKNRLMDELKTALEEEKQRAEEELAAFTMEEKNRRTLALQEYATSLKANIETDLTEEKEAIIEGLDKEYNQAIEELTKPSTPIEPKPTPTPTQEPEPEPEDDMEASQNPVPEIEEESGEEMEMETEGELEVEVTPEPEAELEQ